MTAGSRYRSLETERSPQLDRAKQVARYTIPWLFAEPNVADVQDYQSVGARCVNNLAAKLLLAMFPPGASFFRFTLDDFVVESLAQKDPTGDARGLMEGALGKMERSISTRLEQSGYRSQVATLFKHLIIGGNGLLQVLPNGRLKFHGLRSYVVKRDLDGNVLEIIVKECLAYDSLSDDIRAQLPTELQDTSKRDSQGDVDVFTHVKLVKSRWQVYKEIQGTKIDGTNASYPKDKSPFLPLRFIVVDGEDYGRGYAEEYLGDLKTYDSFSESMVEFAAVAAKILFFVDDNGATSKREIEEAPNGAILDGKSTDVSVLEFGKQVDFGMTKDVMSAVGARLEQAFLMYSSVQRQAERVTAEEIRLMAGELEQVLGGIYSILAQELQLPLVVIYSSQLQREGKLPTLPKGTASPSIVTGLEGLGRNSDAQKIQQLLGSLTVLGPAAIAEYVNTGAVANRMCAYIGLDATGLIRSEDDVQKERAQQAQNALNQKAVGPGINAAAQLQQQQTQPNG